MKSVNQHISDIRKNFFREAADDIDEEITNLHNSKNAYNRYWIEEKKERERMQMLYNDSLVVIHEMSQLTQALLIGKITPKERLRLHEITKRFVL